MDNMQLPNVPASMHDALSRAWEWASRHGRESVDVALVYAIHRRKHASERKRTGKFVALEREPSVTNGKASPLADLLDGLPASAREEFERCAASWAAGNDHGEGLRSIRRLLGPKRVSAGMAG